MGTMTVAAGNTQGTITHEAHLRKTSTTTTSIMALLDITTKLNIHAIMSATRTTVCTTSRITHITTVAIA